MSTKTLTRPAWGVIPASALQLEASAGARLVNPRSLGLIKGVGGADQRFGGFNAAADLVTVTADGFDLNLLWTEFQQTMALANAERQRLVDLLTFSVTDPIERVPQTSGARFERASEYGEPRGIRPQASVFRMGYGFEWYDVGIRYTWKFLADAPASQIQANNNMVIEADNQLVFNVVMDALFSNVNKLADINGQQDVNVYSLYNGDGTVPPQYKTNVFDGTHTHYLTTGTTTIQSADVDDQLEHLNHHGYNKANGNNLFILMNSREAKVARTWRISTGSTWDFIPSTGQPAQFMPQDALLMNGPQPGNQFQGLDVWGSYGNALIVVEDMIPAGYAVAIATGGQANLSNVVGIREHSNASLRGLRLVKGPNPDYPLVDSFYQRGLGTGIRHRGGAVVMQVTTSATYTPPPAFNDAV